MDKTIFERIIAREIPSTIEYEDDEIIAIRDIAPSAPIHILIIPKRVIRSVDALESTDASLIGRVFLVARDLARKFGVADDGYRVVTNCNDHGGQTVFHIHFHLLGGQPLGRMNSLSETHVQTPASPSRGSLFFRESSVFVICAIVLAIGFNMANPKRISWIKPEFQRVQANDEDLRKYLPPPPPPAATTISQAPPPGGTGTELRKPEQTKVQQSPTGSQQQLPQVTSKPTFTPEPGIVREIGYDAFMRFLQSGSYYLIDARGPEKFAEAHIKGATNFFGGEVESRIPDILRSVPKDRVILIYCDGGECELSHHVAEILKNFGYGPMFIYTGGWAEWTSKHKQ